MRWNRILRGLIVTAALVGGALLCAGCDTATTWSEFDGTNLIAGQDFSAQENGWAPNPAARGFMRWESAESNAYPTLPEDITGRPVYRLEMLNVLANGDFEAQPSAPPEPDHWIDLQESLGDGTPGAIELSVLPVADFNAVNDPDLAPLHDSQVLSVSFEGVEEVLYTDLTQTSSLNADIFELNPDLSAADVFAQDRRFAFFLDFRTPVDTFSVSLGNVAALDTDEQNQIQISRGEPGTDAVTYSYPGTDLDNQAVGDPSRNQFTVIDPTFAQLSIGGFNARTQQRADGVFDNIRLTAGSQRHSVTLSVPFAGAGRPSLADTDFGVWTFSVWVARDLTAGTGNRFSARYLNVHLRRPAPDGGDQRVQVRLDAAQTVENWGIGWTRVSVDLPGLDLPNFPQDDQIAIELELEVGNSAEPAYHYPGSVLLAAPALEWDEG